MKHKFKYILTNYSRSEYELLRDKFVPNLEKNALKGNTTIDVVLTSSLVHNFNILEINLEVLSNSNHDLLANAIAGGLGNTVGKGKIKRIL